MVFGVGLGRRGKWVFCYIRAEPAAYIFENNDIIFMFLISLFTEFGGLPVSSIGYSAKFTFRHPSIFSRYSRYKLLSYLNYLALKIGIEDGLY